jgi:esterase/lipase
MVMTEWMFLGIFGAAVIVISIFHAYVYYKGIKRINAELTHFSYIEEYDSYPDAAPQFFTAQTKRPYGVLLLQGFSLSPQEYSPLFPALKEAGINYYAPTLTGFGIRTPVYMAHVSYKDWLRDTIEAYDLLSQTVEKVHVVGTSLGAALGVMLSRYRDVDKLILLSPALYLEPELQRSVWLSNVSIISTIAQWFYPFYTKQVCRPGSRLDLCSVQTSIATFHHTTFPIHVARAVDQTLAHVDFNRARFKQLIVFYGKQDQVSDVSKFLKQLDEKGVPYTSKCYDNSAHILTLDYDSAEVIQDIISELQQSTPKLTYKESALKKLPKPSSKSTKT